MNLMIWSNFVNCRSCRNWLIVKIIVECYCRNCYCSIDISSGVLMMVVLCLLFAILSYHWTHLDTINTGWILYKQKYLSLMAICQEIVYFLSAVIITAELLCTILIQQTTSLKLLSKETSCIRYYMHVWRLKIF